jgi:hypothetical protein
VRPVFLANKSITASIVSVFSPQLGLRLMADQYRIDRPSGYRAIVPGAEYREQRVARVLVQEIVIRMRQSLVGKPLLFAADVDFRFKAVECGA